ncbi:hypothetical protein [Kordiimonas sediminis]|uniref:hypothetical protein n=1 Tax=Kordiimonas sediminis TaxID=1735581 RepID=UPI00174C83F8|nr:hypothetical protein [Kordiimonas sediminis]
MTQPEFRLFLTPTKLIDRVDDSFIKIMRWSEIDLFRQPIGFLFPADAHGRLEKLMDADMSLFKDIVFPNVPLRVSTGGYINFDMKVVDLEDGKRQLDFYKPGRLDGSASDSAAGPTDMYSFFNFVEKLLASPYDGDMGVTMVDVGGLRDDSILDEAQKAEVKKEVEATLKRQALGGHVGMLDDASYGLITTGDFDEESFEKELATVATKLNINPAVLGARSANIKVDDREIDPKELRQALNHSRGVFLGEIESKDDLESLTGVLDGIKHNRRLIEDALREYKYRTSPRLVMDNVATVSLAVLQQGKVNLERQLRLPSEIIVMEDHPDLAYAHDMAQLEELIRMKMRRDDPSEREKVEFYDLCRSTLALPDFETKLQGMITQNRGEARLIGFRIKGMPPVKRGGIHWDVVKRLAKQGHPVWVDRFGDAVVDPGAMTFLQGGFVEMPHDMMKKLAGHFDGKEMMAKLVETWKALNVQVLSADLPNYEMKTLAQQLGISVSVADDVSVGG